MADPTISHGWVTSQPDAGKDVDADNLNDHQITGFSAAVDARIAAAATSTDARTPTGAAGGDLSGTYPNPSVVDDSHAHTSATLPAAGADLSAINFLVGTASALLSAEIAVGTTPGGELGGTWASPTVDATHSGSSHAGLSGQPGSTDVAVADGGTGASTAAAARTNLGLVIGTDVRAQGSGDPTRASLGLATSDSPEFAALNVGAATDTTITRTGAGDIAVEGHGVYRDGGTDVAVADGGTGASTAAGARTNLGLGTLATQSGTFSGTSSGTNTGDQSLPTRASLGLDTTDSPQFAGVNVGAATDTTITRVSAGVIAVEGATVYAQGGALGTPASGTATNLTGTAAGLTAGTVTTNANLTGDVTSSGNATTIGSGKVTEAMQVLADNTTQNVSTTKHGYAPKAPNDATKYLDGTGAYSTPAGVANIRGTVASNGTTVTGTGFTSAHTGTGHHTVSFTSAFAATPVVVASVNQSSTATMSVESIGTGGFQVFIADLGSLVDKPWNFIAMAAS